MTKLNSKSMRPLALWLATLLAVSSLIGFFSKSADSAWYAQLKQSSLTPPPVTFGIVWPILYVLLAIAAWRLFNGPKKSTTRLAQTAFIAQLLLNWSWSPVFFSMHWLNAAWIIIVLILALVAIIAVPLWQRNRMVVYLMLPYALWLCFALYLAGFVAIHN